VKLGERIKERRFQLGALAIIIAVVCVIAIVFKITGSTGFCKSCHEMKPQFDEIQASKHRSSACVECHLKPGLIGTIQTKLSALPELIVHLGGIEAEEIEAKKRVPNVLCIKCHDYPPIVYLGADLAYDLKKHVEAGDVYCSECHMRKDHFIKSKPVDRLLK